MKIIKENKPFENWSLEVVCTGENWNQNDKTPCNSVLELDINDLMKRKWFKYPNDSGLDYGFTCPVCQCFTDIDKKNLSEHLKSMAKDYDKRSDDK